MSSYVRWPVPQSVIDRRQAAGSRILIGLVAAEPPVSAPTATGRAKGRGTAVGLLVVTAPAAIGRARGRATATGSLLIAAPAAAGRARGRGTGVGTQVAGGSVPGVGRAKARGRAIGVQLFVMVFGPQANEVLLDAPRELRSRLLGAAVVSETVLAPAAVGRSRGRGRGVGAAFVSVPGQGRAKARGTATGLRIVAAAAHGRARGRGTAVGGRLVTAPSPRGRGRGWGRATPAGAVLGLPVADPIAVLTDLDGEAVLTSVSGDAILTGVDG
jgi:hypothetical protein